MILRAMTSWWPGASLRPRNKITHSVSRIDLQQRGHRGAPVPGGRAWRSLTCEGGRLHQLKAAVAVAGFLLLNVQMFAKGAFHG
jgi:hypothetical protein